MSNGFIMRAAAALLILCTVMAAGCFAQEIVFRKSLTAADRRCLSDMLRNGRWRLSPEFHEEMIAAAVVARLNLNGRGDKHYIFVINDPGFCGTAGCSMLIGEADKQGACHEIYSGSGDSRKPKLTDTGFDPVMEVLRRRDHGYRRLYTPCELRFDGHEYQQIHDECPTIDVQR